MDATDAQNVATRSRIDRYTLLGTSNRRGATRLSNVDLQDTFIVDELDNELVTELDENIIE